MGKVKKILIVIGGDIDKDFKDIFDNTEKAMKEQINDAVYLDKESDLDWFLSKKGKLLVEERI